MPYTAAAKPRYSLQDAARALGISSRELFSELRQRRILDASNLPRWRWKRAGYLLVKESTFRHPIVGTKPYSRVFVTDRGLSWLRQLLPSATAATEYNARTDQLLHEIANMNPDAGEIGPGMLRHIVAEARELTGEASA